MATTPLPERPRLEQLRKRARELQRAGAPGLQLTVAQRELARTYGFASWARLKAHVEQIEARTWQLPTTGADTSSAAFLRAACVTYSDAPRPEPTVLDRLRRRAPALAVTDAAVALAAADVDAIRDHLAAGLDVDAATGPLDWPPLMYLTYSRLDAGEQRTLATARLLLEAGADPDAGRYFLGYPTPFTLLTGAFGDGEQGEPAHPHAVPLARVLLEAGADPNDAQTLYNRQFAAADDFLEVLFEFGLGSGDGGPWRRRLPDLTPSPVDLVRRLLGWAVTHDQRARVVLLAAHGVDVVAPLPTGSFGGARVAGRTPIDAALSVGHRALAADLQRLGAGEPTLTPVDTFVGAVLAGDAPAVADTSEAVRAQAHAARPALLVWAAALPHPAAAHAAVTLALDDGFGIDALGRADVPVEQPWQTALHTAVERDDPSLVRLLLDRGADPTVRDARFGATPRGWAEFLDRPRVLGLLPEPAPEPAPESAPDPAPESGPTTGGDAPG